MNQHRVLMLDGESNGANDPLPGYEVVSVKNDLELLHLLAQDHDVDLILGDVGMPDILTTLRRKYPSIPVIVLAKEPDLKAAFQAGQCGAACYLPASVDKETLTNRMDDAIQQAIMPPDPETSPLHPARRPRRADDEPRFLSARELTIDRHRRVALFRQEPLELTRSELDILSYLVENQGRVVPFEELAFMLQGKYPKHDEARRSLSAHVTYLRDALKKAGCLNYILNIRGRGYVIESEVEEMLRQSETRLHFLLQQIPAIIWSSDTDLRLTWTGGAGLAGFNLASDDLIGLRVQDLTRIEGDDEPPNVVAMRRALRGERVRFESQRLDTIFEVHVEPLHDAQGNIEGTIGIALNITERKRAEEALRRSEKLYHTLVSNLPDSAVYLYDHDLRFLLAGGAALDSSGLSIEEVEGKTLYDIATPDSLAILEPYYRAALAGSESTFELPMRDRIYFVHTLPVRNGNSEVFAGMVVVQDITERKQAEERLRESEERYRIISGMMSDYVYASRLLPGDEYNTEVDWVAGALTHITGFTQQEARSGMRWDQLVHPDDWPIVERRRQALLAGQQDTSEFRMRGKHGRIYWLRTYSYPLWDEREGRVVSIFAAVKDITAWKEAEQALVQERNLLQTILETAPDQIYVKDLDSRFVLANPKTWQLHNLTASSDLLGKTDQDIFGAEGEADLVAEANLFATGQPIVNEERFTPESLGGPRWSLVTKVPLYDSDRKIIGLVGVNRDVTELKRVEAVLREKEAGLRSLIASTPAPMLIFQETMMRFVNPAAVALTGYTLEELQAMTFWDVIHPDMRDQIRERGMQRQQGAPVPSRYEVKLLTKSGDERWVDYMGTIIQYEGKPAVLGVVFDITDRKRTETALRQSEERLRMVISHAPIYLWAINKEGVYTLAEGQAMEALGLRPGEPVGKSIFEVNRDRPDLQHHINRALAGELFNASVEPVQGVFFETNYLPVRDVNGVVAGVLGISVDVTGRYPPTTASALA